MEEEYIYIKKEKKLFAYVATPKPHPPLSYLVGLVLAVAVPVPGSVLPEPVLPGLHTAAGTAGNKPPTQPGELSGTQGTGE